MGQKISRFLIYTVWAVAMSALTYILGGVPLRALRRKYGRWPYWLMSLAVSGALLVPYPALAAAFFSLAALMGVFSELEELGLSFSLSAFFTLLIHSLLAGGGFALWVFSTRAKWNQQLLSALEKLLQPLAQLNPDLKIDYFEIMLQLPSVLLILWMVTIYLAVLFDPRDQKESAVPSMRQQLNEFRVPDAVVWLLIAALLGAFGDFGIRWVASLAINVLNVCLLLFFFQGIAVVRQFFDSLRMGPFWQLLFMVLIIIHLFLLVSAIGLIDYWLDFRTRLTKRTQET